MVTDVRLVRRVLAELADSHVNLLLMGGWAEDLHGLTSPRTHTDIDVLLLDPEVCALDRYVDARDEVVAKRLVHKRAVVDGVLLELFIARRTVDGDRDGRGAT